MKSFAVTALAGVAFAAESSKCEMQAMSLHAACKKSESTIRQSLDKIKSTRRRKEAYAKYASKFKECHEGAAKVDSMCKSKKAPQKKEPPMCSRNLCKDQFDKNISLMNNKSPMNTNKKYSM